MPTWTVYGKDFRTLQKEIGLQVGMKLRVVDSKSGESEFLVGDLNLNGGVCDCCEAFAKDDIIHTYLMPEKGENQ